MLKTYIISTATMQFKLKQILLLATAWMIGTAVAQSPQTYYINPTGFCSSDAISKYEACYSIQQLAGNITNGLFQENFTLVFAPGKHFLDGGIELNNTVNVVFEGQLINDDKPEIKCMNKSCFSFYNSSNIHFSNLSFTESYNEYSSGGAIFAYEAKTITITHCSFTNNLVRNQGGAMRLKLIDSVRILQSQFINNSATCYSSDIGYFFGYTFCRQPNCIGLGGAISAANVSSFVIEDSLFDGNSASCYSGAVVQAFCNTRIIRSKFIRNSVAVSEGDGGGLAIDTSSVLISESVFEQNSAGGSGGSITVFDSTMDIKSSSFVSNLANVSGGGIYISNTISSIENSHFSKNMANNAGGGVMMALTHQQATISNCTFRDNGDNSLSEGGGALYIQLSGEPNCTVSCGMEVISDDSEPTVSIIGNIFESNAVSLTGGAIWALKGVMSIMDNSFYGNIGPLGAAVALFHSIAYLRGNIFEKGKALQGGALYLSDGILHSNTNRYLNNDSPSGGGAIVAIKVTVVSKNDEYVNNTAVYRGGAINAWLSDVFITESVYFNNSVITSGGAVSVWQGSFTSTNSLYKANSAAWNGGALILVRSPVIIKGDRYEHNKVDYGEAAAIFQADRTIQLNDTIFTENTPVKPAVWDQLYTIQLTKVRGYCHNLTFSNNIGSMYSFYGTIEFSGQTSFLNNSGKTGGALTLVQCTATFNEFSSVIIQDNTAENGGGVFLSQGEIIVNTPFFDVSSNKAKTSGGGISAFQSLITIDLSQASLFESDSVSLTNNAALQDGGALNAISTTLRIIQASVVFNSNEAAKGGAAFLSESSKIYLQKTREEFSDQPNTRLRFSNNSADNGGALYVSDITNTGVLCASEQSTIRNPGNQIPSITTKECFIQTLRLYYPQNFTYNVYNYRNIFFEDNNGNKQGSDIYGGLLDRCEIHSFAEIRNLVSLYNLKLSGSEYLRTISQFQVDADYNLTDILADNRNLTRENVKHLISSDPVQICFCTEGLYNCSYQLPTVFAKRGEAFSVEVVAVDQMLNPVNGTIEATVLSSGARLKVGQSKQATAGVCTELIFNIFSTEQNASFELYPDGPCSNIGISSKIVTVTFVPCKCPSGLQPAPLDNECRCECDSSLESYISSCQLDNNLVTVTRVKQDFWIHYLVHNNVTGFLIKNCPFEYCLNNPVNLSISLPSYADKQCAHNRTGTLCGECEEGLSLIFGSSRCIECSNNYLALITAFALAGIALVTFILVLNMTVAIGDIHGLILYANIIAANASTFLPLGTAMSFFVSWVNLDLGIEACFYDGMDSYAKVLLQLVFPSYILLLSVLIIIVSNYWNRFAKLIGRKNPVATLCTLFFLSYSKLLRIIIDSLQFVYLTYPDGSRDTLWAYNPSIPYFTPSRAPFFIVSFIIIALGSVYTVLLLFGQCFAKCTCIHSNKYNAFIDAYHAPFAFKHRYWIGLLLVTRIVHHLLSSILDESTHLLIVSSLICSLLILKQLIGQVYKNWLVSFLETIFFVNLVLFSVSSYFVSVSNGNQVALANASVSVSFTTFIGIVLYHTHAYILKGFKTYVNKLTDIQIQSRECCQEISKKLINASEKCCHNKPKKANQHSLNDANSNEVLPNLEITSNEAVELFLREPDLDILSPITTSDYALPVIPTTGNSVVTTTTVSVKKEMEID